MRAAFFPSEASACPQPPEKHRAGVCGATFAQVALPWVKRPGATHLVEAVHSCAALRDTLPLSLGNPVLCVDMLSKLVELARAPIGLRQIMLSCRCQGRGIRCQHRCQHRHACTPKVRMCFLDAHFTTHEARAGGSIGDNSPCALQGNPSALSRGLIRAITMRPNLQAQARR